jgi:DNA-binding IclR family transcriptional regulator
VKRAVVAKKPASTRPASKIAISKADLPRKPVTVVKATPPAKIPDVHPAETKPSIDMVARERELARERTITAVNRALSLLETLARTGPVPLAVLADAAGCGRTAAFELLTTMQTRNFVIQDDSRGLWRLGARWAVLGSAASEQGALAATAMPYLAALGNATGENVYLRVREGMETETVAIYQTDPGLRVYTEVGKRMPLHAGSGRLLLAHAPEAVQTQVLAQRLQRYTPSTRTDATWIAGDLHRIRQRGFLITDSEVVAGTVSVCAPVRDSSGQVVAAMLIGAPSLRMRPPRPRALMPAVVEAARKLSHALGLLSEQPAPSNGPLDPGRPDSGRIGEPRRIGEFAPSPWPATALGATISRPHSIFR